MDSVLNTFKLYWIANFDFHLAKIEIDQKGANLHFSSCQLGTPNLPFKFDQPKKTNKQTNKQTKNLKQKHKFDQSWQLAKQK